MMSPPRPKVASNRVRANDRVTSSVSPPAIHPRNIHAGITPGRRNQFAVWAVVSGSENHRGVSIGKRMLLTLKMPTPNRMPGMKLLLSCCLCNPRSPSFCPSCLTSTQTKIHVTVVLTSAYAKKRANDQPAMSWGVHLQNAEYVQLARIRSNET